MRKAMTPNEKVASKTGGRPARTRRPPFERVMDGPGAAGLACEDCASTVYETFTETVKGEDFHVLTVQHSSTCPNWPQGPGWREVVVEFPPTRGPTR